MGLHRARGLGVLWVYVLYSQVQPHTTTCGSVSEHINIMSLVNEDAIEDKDYKADDITFIWDITTQEDTTIIENNQKGVLSHSFVPGVLSENESAVTYFYDWYFTNMQLP